jgi:hypothetical protein
MQQKTTDDTDTESHRLHRFSQIEIRQNSQNLKNAIETRSPPALLGATHRAFTLSRKSHFLDSEKLKLALCPSSLVATHAILPSVSLIPFAPFGGFCRK